MTKKADTLHIRPLDENALPPTETASSTQKSDPRVAAFLERLRTKADELETTQRENHVTAKEPRRRPITEKPANPDWYQAVPAKKAAAPVSMVKRFVSGKSYPGRKPKAT